MTVHVAVGVIINGNKEVLIAKRSADQHQGNKWEFPGGKVEDNESSEAALGRELNEELGIEIGLAEHFIDIKHYYQGKSDDAKTVFLHVFIVRDWLGEAEGKEGQPLRWVNQINLDNYDFPAANVEIIRKLAQNLT